MLISELKRLDQDDSVGKLNDTCPRRTRVLQFGKNKKKLSFSLKIKELISFACLGAVGVLVLILMDDKNQFYNNNLLSVNIKT